jgi:hypothetical protein
MTPHVLVLFTRLDKQNAPFVEWIESTLDGAGLDCELSEDVDTDAAWRARLVIVPLTDYRWIEKRGRYLEVATAARVRHRSTCRVELGHVCVLRSRESPAEGPGCSVGPARSVRKPRQLSRQYLAKEPRAGPGRGRVSAVARPALWSPMRKRPILRDSLERQLIHIAG